MPPWNKLTRIRRNQRSVSEDRRYDTMHILIITLVICLLVPFVGRLIAGFFKGAFWLLLVLVGLAVIGAFSH
jgi:hypothetical protein